MIRSFLTLVGALALSASATAQAAQSCPSHLDVEVRRLHSDKTENLCQHYQAGRPLLVVNTASHCGFTRQFSGLEALHQKYRQAGLIILGFPSNSFKQEEKSEERTASVCYENYGVTFPMYEHVAVTGNSAHPLFAFLAEQTQAPQWNFNKYLLLDGEVVHFGSAVEPLESELEKKIAASVKVPQ